MSEIIRQHSSFMGVQPTDVQPVLRPLDGIRAVLFDVYGTLIISGSGDVGTEDVGSQPRAFADALAAVGLQYLGDEADGVRLLTQVIAVHHERDRQRGVEYPEVHIDEVWADVVARLKSDRRLVIPGDRPPIDTAILALEYEVRSNPVWPVPGVAECLQQLREVKIPMGIVSNAQSFTRLLFPVLLGESLEELGFREPWCFWSYRYRQAKPGTFLFERAREAVVSAGIAAHEVLYVGNDMLKDIWPASRVGFRTALFAGDMRSYRPRTDDPRVSGLAPDLILTEFAQLPGCILRNG